MVPIDINDLLGVINKKQNNNAQLFKTGFISKKYMYLKNPQVLRLPGGVRVL